MHTSNLTFPILLSIAQIGGLMLIGAVARYLRYIDERDIDRWSRMVLDFLYPAFIFTTIIAGFEHDRLRELWSLPLLGLGIALSGLLLGLILKYGLGSKDPDLVRTFLYGCVVNNFGYLPIVIVSNLWGKTMLAGLFLLTLGSTIAMWTFGVGVLGSGDARTIMRNLFSPTLIAIVAGIAASLSGIDHHIPGMADHILVSAGSAAVPLMLILSGASLFKPSAWKIDWQVAYLTIVRLIALPACIILALKALPLSPDVYTLSVIVALMPLAVSQVIFIRVFGGHPDFAASSSLVSTIASIVTIPVALWLLFG
jgi:predicted permease